MIKYDPEKNPWQCHLCIFKMRRTIESTNWECSRGEDVDDCTFREIHKSAYKQALLDVDKSKEPRKRTKEETDGNCDGCFYGSPETCNAECCDPRK